MTDFQAALGSAQMDRAEAIIAERRRLAARYDDAFAELAWLRTPPRINAYGHGYQSYACLFQPEPVTPASVAAVNACATPGWTGSCNGASRPGRPPTRCTC